MLAYDPRARRYRDDTTGRFLPHSTAEAFVDLSIGYSDDHMDSLAHWVKSGIISPEDWAARMRAEIKAEAIRQAILGAGGREQMDAAAWGRVGAFLHKQYGHLDGKPDSFYDAVAHGDLSEKAIAARAHLYSNACRETYEKEFYHRLTDPEFGVDSIYDECRWVVDIGAEHCPDCLALAALGWMKVADLHQMPGDGSTQCRSNCRCRVEYRNAKTGMTYGQLEPQPTEPLVGVPYYPTPEQTQVALDQGQQYLNQAARWDPSHPQDPAVIEEKVLAAIHAATDGKAPSVRAQVSSSIDILKDGRFKTQFETGHSEGTFKPESRRIAEELGMGAPLDLPDAKRPIYGYYPTGFSSQIIGYGPVEFQLKESVVNRTTISLGDSLSNMKRGVSIVVPASQPSKAAFMDVDDLVSMADRGSPYSYLEAQIHDGLPTSEVAKIVVHKKRGDKFYAGYFDKIEELAGQAGIEVEYDEQGF